MSEKIPAQNIDDEVESFDLYEKRKKIYTRSISGFFQKIRTRVLWLLMLGYFLTPWIHWHDRQGVLFDLPARQFHIFNITFFPQDFYLLGWILIICAFGLFFATTLFGRVWCGYTCPQTVSNVDTHWANVHAQVAVNTVA